MTQPTLPSISILGRRFVDDQGREVILHGANLVNKNPLDFHPEQSGAADLAAMRAWGFNCLRLGFTWAGIEPEPGRIDEGYLSKIDQLVNLAAQNGLFIFLDMHQDLYSTLYSDGAPAWATLTGGAEHIHLGGVWSDAYFTSPAVQAALDNFWGNAPAPDGTGLQEHYAACWQALARRYTHEPAVIGYDLMNEPFPGSAALPSQMMLFARGAELLAQIDPSQACAPEELAAQWLDPVRRCQILALLEDPRQFAAVIDVTQPIYAAFESEQLMPFYRRVADAIRAVDPGRALFLETSMGSNMGVYSGVQALRGADGELLAPQVYAAHGYDLVVDTPGLAGASSARVELIFRRHGETARRLGLPMLVGEWGAFDAGVTGTLPAAWAVSRLFEDLLCGDTYWHYAPHLDRLPPFQAISRPYPERIAGRLISYRYDPDEACFECAWEEDPAVTAPSVFYLPAWFYDPRAAQILGWPCVSSGQGLWLSIPPERPGTSKPIPRSLRIHAKPA